MIEFKNVEKSFGAKAVLRGISFTVHPGEIVFLLGKSGVGKSVTLRHLVGLVEPDSGEIWIDGVEVTRFDERQWMAVRRKCALVFQQPALMDSLSVEENLLFGLRAMGNADADLLTERARKALGQVQLPEEILGKMPSELSHGYQKRVSMARAVVLEPKYLLFDEPTTSLDPVASQGVQELIVRLCKTLNAGALVVSHDMPGALAIADRILLIEGGRILDHGTPAEIRGSAVPLTQAFLIESGVA